MKKQWIKFGLVTLLYLLFLLWVKSWWGLLLLPFIYDAYISKKIPWKWWKKSDNSTVRTVMDWIDAIVFALVGVYFVHIYVFQNYQIPTSSLEKSLLVGDYLFVSKASYGPRVPQTPLSMPLTQHTMPWGGKSYLEWPKWEYKRVAGFGKVKLNDIVVFNFPAGDTVALNNPAEDFYSIAYREGRRIYPKKIEMDSLNRWQQRAVFDLYYNAGRKQILGHPEYYGKVITRPVDRRENYVKRCETVDKDGVAEIEDVVEEKLDSDEEIVDEQLVEIVIEDLEPTIEENKEETEDNVLEEVEDVNPEIEKETANEENTTESEGAIDD